MPENLENDKLNRVWEYRLHVEKLFYSRLNFFLIFESVLLGVVGALYDKANSAMLMLRGIVILGLCITVIWMLVQARQKLMFDAVSDEVAEKMPEYVETWDRISKKLAWFFRSVPAVFLLTYIVPLLIALMWIGILFFL